MESESDRKKGSENNEEYENERMYTHTNEDIETEAAADRLILDDVTVNSALTVDDTISINSKINLIEKKGDDFAGKKDIAKEEGKETGEIAEGFSSTQSNKNTYYNKGVKNISTPKAADMDAMLNDFKGKVNKTIHSVKDLINNKDKLSVITTTLKENFNLPPLSPIRTPASLYEVNHYREPLFAKSPVSLKETCHLMKRTVKTAYRFVSPRPHLKKEQYDTIIDHILDCFWEKMDRRISWKKDAAVVLQKYIRRYMVQTVYLPRQIELAQDINNKVLGDLNSSFLKQLKQDRERQKKLQMLAHNVASQSISSAFYKGKRRWAICFLQRIMRGYLARCLVYRMRYELSMQEKARLARERAAAYDTSAVALKGMDRYTRINWARNTGAKFNKNRGWQHGGWRPNDDLSGTYDIGDYIWQPPQSKAHGLRMINIEIPPTDKNDAFRLLNEKNAWCKLPTGFKKKTKGTRKRWFGAPPRYDTKKRTLFAEQIEENLPEPGKEYDVVYNWFPAAIANSKENPKLRRVLLGTGGAKLVQKHYYPLKPILIGGDRKGGKGGNAAASGTDIDTCNGGGTGNKSGIVSTLSESGFIETGNQEYDNEISLDCYLKVPLPEDPDYCPLSLSPI